MNMNEVTKVTLPWVIYHVDSVFQHACMHVWPRGCPCSRRESRHRRWHDPACCAIPLCNIKYPMPSQCIAEACSPMHEQAERPSRCTAHVPIKRQGASIPLHPRHALSLALSLSDSCHVLTTLVHCIDWGVQGPRHLSVD